METENLQESKTVTDNLNELDTILNNPENKKNALHMASEILALMGKNFFTYTAYRSKSGFDRNTAYQKLKSLELFGYAKMKFGDFRDGKESLRIPMFKIIISNQDKVDAINVIIQYHQDQIDQLEIQKKQYQREN